MCWRCKGRRVHEITQFRTTWKEKLGEDVLFRAHRCTGGCHSFCETLEIRESTVNALIAKRDALLKENEELKAEVARLDAKATKLLKIVSAAKQVLGQRS